MWPSSIYDIKTVFRILLKAGFLFSMCWNSYAQTPNIADSLENIYNSQNLQGIEKLKLLRQLSENSTDPSNRLKYSTELIEAAKAKDCTGYLYAGRIQRGNAFTDKGDYSNALENYFQAATIAKDEREEGIIKITIADIYSYMANHERSIRYYNEAIEVLRKVEDSLNLASALLNAGDEYLNSNKLDTALSYFNEAETIFRKLDYNKGTAYSMGNRGLVFAKLGRNEEAEKSIKEAVEILDSSQLYAPICIYLNAMSDIYNEKGEDTIAMEFAHLSLDLAKSYGFKTEISDANLRLSLLYEKNGHIPESFKHYKEYIAYRDSVTNVSTAQQISGLRADYEVAQKQAEVDLLNQQRKNQKLLVTSVIGASVLIALLAFGLYRRNLFIKRTSKIIEKEKNRSDRLLLNILPEETAKELKKHGKVKAKKFEAVTVLFADFKKFTLYAEQLSPEKLIESVDFYFSRFDEIIEKYGIEKIKTIGDSYMAASGLPFPSEDHAIRMVKAAFEMIEFVKESKGTSSLHDADFDVRIGISSGPVIAGVVGTKKFAYDIWGDTVNIASRMESHSDVGRVNISETTYILIKKEYDCEYRGEVEVKNGRVLDMYYVNSHKKDLKATFNLE